MTEEEKAIDYLNDCLFSERIPPEYCEAILNLIEKQQKEIEELKEEIEELKEKYVRKSKLTSLLKRLKASAWHFDSEKNNIINRLIDSFEELLKE